MDKDLARSDSPPRAWGGLLAFAESEAGLRLTPTGMGRTLRHLRFHKCTQDWTLHAILVSRWQSPVATDWSEVFGWAGRYAFRQLRPRGCEVGSVSPTFNETGHQVS